MILLHLNHQNYSYFIDFPIFFIHFLLLTLLILSNILYFNLDSIKEIKLFI